MASSSAQKRMKQSQSVHGWPPISDAFAQPPKIFPSRVKMPTPPIQVWMPNQAQATAARISAGRLAPRSPKEARASTGKGMPYLGPACPVSSMGPSTIRLASAMVNTACFQSMPRATRPEASSQDGMLWAMPTQSAVKLYVVQRRRSRGTGNRSSLTNRLSVGTAPGASSMRPEASGIGSCGGTGGTGGTVDVMAAGPFARERCRAGRGGAGRGEQRERGAGTGVRTAVGRCPGRGRVSRTERG